MFTYTVYYMAALQETAKGGDVLQQVANMASALLKYI